MTYPSPPRRGRRVMAVRAPRTGAGPPLVPPRAYGAAGSRTGARRHVCAYRHRSRAGPREPAAPGPSIPYHRHSRQPHPIATPALPPKRREPPRPALPPTHTPTPTHPMHPLITAPTAARRSPPTAAGVHPVTQAPTRPSPTTTGTGLPRQHPSRAPPPPACRKPILVREGGAARQPAAPALQGIDPHGDR